MNVPPAISPLLCTAILLENVPPLITPRASTVTSFIEASPFRVPPVISPVAATMTVLMPASISSVTSIGAVMVSVPSAIV